MLLACCRTRFSQKPPQRLNASVCLTELRLSGPATPNGKDPPGTLVKLKT